MVEDPARLRLRTDGRGPTLDASRHHPRRSAIVHVVVSAVDLVFVGAAERVRAGRVNGDVGTSRESLVAR